MVTCVLHNTEQLAELSQRTMYLISITDSHRVWVCKVMCSSQCVWNHVTGHLPSTCCVATVVITEATYRGSLMPRSHSGLGTRLD